MKMAMNYQMMIGTNKRKIYSSVMKVNLIISPLVDQNSTWSIQ